MPADTVTDDDEVVLPTFALLARFREPAADVDAAVAAVTARLSAQDEPFQEVTVEREEAPGTWMVVARFVLASLDAETAVRGLYGTLVGAGLTPDEVWVDAQL